MSNRWIIEVENLTKRYAGQTAIDGLTFSVGRVEIVGFLGPNGAGKSTTMRILACFMSATAGLARVAGFDVLTQSHEVRRRIGYMPENNPLHLDMRVREYLKFRARLKGPETGRPHQSLLHQLPSAFDVDRAPDAARFAWAKANLVTNIINAFSNPINPAKA